MWRVWGVRCRAPARSAAARRFADTKAPAASATDVPGVEPNAQSSTSMSPRYKPTNIEKRILVWTKKFKSTEEVPQFVKLETIERARSEARIKLSNIMILLTILASIGAVIAGKSAAKRGESVHQNNIDWHKQYAEDYNKKQEAAKK